MPRHRDDDRPHRSHGNGLAMWLILGVVTAILVLCTGVTTLGLFMWWRVGTAVEAAVSEAKAGPAAKYTRQELRDELTGKSKDEVLKLVGKPERAVEPQDGNYWIYHNLSRDPVSGKTDFMVWVRFDGADRVWQVDY